MRMNGKERGEGRNERRVHEREGKKGEGRRGEEMKEG